MWWTAMFEAWAAPVDRGLQARLFPPAFDFAAEELLATPVSMGPEDIVTKFECYFEVDVQNFNAIASFDAIDITLLDGQLAVDIDLGTVIGYDITVSAYSGWLDLCLDFDATINYLELENGHLTGVLEPVPTLDGMELAFVGDPILDGVIDSDIGGFPDDLLWIFFSGLVKTQVEKALTEQIPVLLTDPIGGVFDSPFGELALAVQVVDIEVEPDGLFAAADVDVGGGGDGRAPHIDLQPKGGAHFAVAITDGVLQDIASVSWGIGALDAQGPVSALLLDELASTLGLPEGVTMSLAVAGNPAVTVGTDAVTLALPSTTLEAWSDGQRLLYLVADLVAEIAPNVEPALGSILLSAHEIQIDVREIDASRLVSTDEGEEHLADFLEGWVAQAIADAIDHTPVFASQFDAWDYVLLLEDSALLDQSIVAWFTVYRSDDPAVDLVPPETDVDVVVTGTLAEVTLGGADDRGGVLAWKWRVDDGTWSSWSTDGFVSLDTLEPGSHTIEAVSRDTWQNEDPTPASAVFRTEAPPVPPPVERCGCNNAPWHGWLAAAATVGLLRRRRLSAR